MKKKKKKIKERKAFNKFGLSLSLSKTLFIFPSRSVFFILFFQNLFARDFIGLYTKRFFDSFPLQFLNKIK